MSLDVAAAGRLDPAVVPGGPSSAGAEVAGTAAD